MEQAQDLTAANQVTPTTAEFDESKGVAGRVDAITRQDSPLMTQADTRGRQAAAARGLTNSSLSAQAAQEAVIGAATPIANADANLYQQQALTNQGARNNASTTNAQIGSSLGGQALGLENSNQQQERSLAQNQSQFEVNSAQNATQIANQASQFGQSLTEQQAQRAQQQQQFTATQQFQGMQAGLDRENQVRLAELQNANQSAISSNGDISQAWQQMSVNISNIQNNPQLDEAAKRTLIQNQMDSFGAFSRFWQSTTGVDVSQLLNFNLPPAPPPPAAPAPPPDPYNGNPGGDSGGD
jgi:hypothetical protein